MAGLIQGTGWLYGKTVYVILPELHIYWVWRLGFGILNDRYYPELQAESEDNFDTPLQLVAQKLRFKDPLSGRIREFTSERGLLW